MAVLSVRAEALRALHHGGAPLLLPNAWDAATARAVALDGGLAASCCHERRALTQLRHELLHAGGAALEHVVADDVRGEDGHAISSVTRVAPDVTWSPISTASAWAS